MPYIPAPDQSQYLNLILQMIQAKKGEQLEQAKRIASTAQPGTTVANSGLTEKEQRRLFGRNVSPDTVLNPETAATKQSKMLLARIDAMKPEEIDMFTSSLLSKEMGVPQVTTGAGLSAQAGASTARSKMQQAITEKSLGWVQEGLAAVQAMAPSDRAAIGAKLSVGASPAEIKVGEKEQAVKETELGVRDTSARIAQETGRVALKIMADPSHSLNKVMEKNLGFNAIEAAGGVALGLSSLLNQSAQIYMFGSGDKRTLEDELDKAEAQWAADVAKNMGGTVTPRAVLNWKRWREGSGDPKKMPAGISKEMDEVLSQGTAISLRAFVTEQAEKGDPQARTVLKIAEGMQRITNPNQLSTFTQVMGNYFGMVQNAAVNGPRPDPAKDPEGAKKWDAAAKKISEKIPKLDPKWWITGGGVEMAPGSPGGPAANPLNYAPPAQGSPQGAPAPTISLPGGQSLPAPGLSEQDVQNIQMLLRVLPGMSMAPAQPPRP